MKKVIVLGSLNMDLVTRVKVTPKVGETILGSGFDKIPGGKGANQAAAIGRLGGNVAMMGMVGDDDFGSSLVKSLSSDGVDIKNVGISADQATGTALIMVNHDGDNSIVVIPGANFDIKPIEIKPENLDGEFLVAQLEVPLDTIEHAFEIGRSKGIYTVLNPAPARELPESLLKNVDLLIPNETEFQMITGFDPSEEEGLKKGSNKLINMGVKEVLVTLGSRGSVLVNSTGLKYFDAHKVKAIDTTAAGDSFIGGLIYNMSNGKSTLESIEFASKVAAIAVTRHGAQSSLPTLDEVIERFGN